MNNCALVAIRRSFFIWAAIETIARVYPEDSPLKKHRTLRRSPSCRFERTLGLTGNSNRLADSLIVGSLSSKQMTRNESDLTPLEVSIPCGAVTLEGALAVPTGAKGVVVFAHGSGSSRHSPRNQFVARVIRESGNGTLLFDLLTAEEEEIEDNVTRGLRFDIGLLARRLAEVTSWLVEQPATRDLGIGYFGS